VPTPFYHLSIADQVVKQPALNPAIKCLINGQLGAFYLGNTAPDVQVISGQTRSDTHFFTVPISPNAGVPWHGMLSEYPNLRASENLDLAQAIFIAGYLCHLQADWIWVNEIFEPVFGPQQNWATFSNRLYWHNILRAYLDVEVFANLQVDQILDLGPVHSQKWLPFIQDHDLENWWIYLCDQLQPGNNVKTVEVFAARQGIDVHEFRTMLQSEESMQENIFNHISRQQLDDYCTRLVAKNVSLIENYLDPWVASASAAAFQPSSFTQQHDRSGI